MSKGLIITPSISEVLERLDDTETGIYLRWMLASYYGNPASLTHERQTGAEVVDRIIRQAVKDLEIIDDRIIINPACAQRQKDEHISQVRARAGRRSQIAQRKSIDQKVVGLDNTAYAAPATIDYDIEERGNVQRLASFGVSQSQAHQALDRLTRQHGEACVIQALDRMEGRRPANPIAYLTRTVENSVRAAAESMPDYAAASAITSPKGNKPKPVRRHIRTAPGAQYELIGWTCENHPRGRDGRRRKIWRTDSGALKYQLPDAGEQIPDFTEEAGYYETD